MNKTDWPISRRTLLHYLPIVVGSAGTLLAGGLAPHAARAQAKQLDVLRLDWATYNPVSLILREKGWLEQSLGTTKVEWVQSAGSNKALEFLNARSIDFGSTAGAAAFIAKANGSPINSVYVFSKPEWTALVTGSTSTITQVKDLKGKKVAVTKGTDPYIFLVRALDEVGLSERDVELVLLQHADGKAALDAGQVDAWAGLDPLMAQTELEQGSKLFYRNTNFNSYGVLNVREAFAKEYPDVVIKVLQAYEKGRKWALENPKELQTILARDARLTDVVAAKQLERTDLSDPIIGNAQKQVIGAAGQVLSKAGVIRASVDVNATVNALIDTQFVAKLG
ncbi:MAG: aliphatic sulfonate ABC transporter substrate-binding protein [Synechococcales cyanobacterium]